MDNCSTPKQNSEQDFLSKRFRILNMLDPRSPTTAFLRTPLQVIVQDSPCNSTTDSVCKPKHVEKSTPMEHQDDSKFAITDDTMYESFDLRDRAGADTSLFSSMSVSTSGNEVDVDEVKSEPDISNTKKQQKEVARVLMNTTPTTPIVRLKSIDVFSNDIENDSFEKIPSKQLFYTPNKKRNPLGPVENICATTSPAQFGSTQNFNQSQWKRIQEERIKLGLDLDENVLLPLNDLTASAPSKLPTRRIKVRAQFDNI